MALAKKEGLLDMLDKVDNINSEYESDSDNVNNADNLKVLKKLDEVLSRIADLQKENSELRDEIKSLRSNSLNTTTESCERTISSDGVIHYSDIAVVMNVMEDTDNKVSTSVALTPTEKEKLNVIAKHYGLTASHIIRRIVASLEI